MSPWPFRKAGRRRTKRLAETDDTRRSIGESFSIPSVLLALVLWVSVLVLLFSNGAHPHSSLAAGQRAPATVVATVDFACEDLSATELAKREAANAVPAVFAINDASFNAAVRSLDKLFARLAQLRQENAQGSSAADREIANVLDLLALPLTPSEARQLMPAGHEDHVLDALKMVLEETWSDGIISPDEKKNSFQGMAVSGFISVRLRDGTLRERVSINDLPTPETALDLAIKRANNRLGNISIPKSALTSLFRALLASNLVYDPTMTDERRQAATKSVEPVTVRIKASTTLVEAGEGLTPQTLEELRAHEMRLRQLESTFDRIIKRIGNAGLLMVALIACVGLLQILLPGVMRGSSTMLLVVALSLLVLLPAKGLLYLSNTTRLIPPAIVEFALPLALAPMLASILAGSAVAIPLGIWNSFAMSVLCENNFTVLTLGLTATVIAVLSTRDVRRRFQIYRAGLFVGLAEMLYAMSLASISQQSVQVLVAQALTSLGSGIACAFLVSLLTPLFEAVFGITTNLTLLELSDMSHPLLQRLAMEAPGTYHHSIVVANLAQAAAGAIGANGLLVRVCAYFHDIGKLAKPEFFTENIQQHENPHDDLTPSMSTLVITSHVKEGVALAHRYKLPRCIIEAIEQHHGSGVVSYFYHVARQQAGEEDGRGVPEEAFRYQGPKPKSREMAILALADAVEAAARSIEKPSPSRIESLVNEIVEGKLHDGQLDDCRLTLAELAAIKRSLVFSLANMLHVRIAYPQDETDTDESADETHGADGQHSPADPAVAGSGTRA